MLYTCALATLGFDLSYYQGDVQQDVFDCLRASGYAFAVLQAQIGSTFNYNCVDSYWRAKAAGIEFVDFYIFPTTAKDPRAQVRETVAELQAANVLDGSMVWLDVENHGLFFESCEDNQNYIAEMLDEASQLLGAGRVGVYSNWVQWQDITCGWTGASAHQLWYPHYDGAASFDDFQPFGGWGEPNIKQFEGDTTVCGTNIDNDFY